MKRTSFDGWPCSIARTVDVLGDAWTLLVLRELFYGERKFDGLVSSLGISRNTLTDRLTTLVERDVVERRAYQSEPVRHEYLLTERGQDLFGVLAVINTWGDTWLSTDDGPPVHMSHDLCGHDFHTAVVCAACGAPASPTDITVSPGPGYPPHLAAKESVARRFA